ncbi:MAG: DNA-protecting protein DprA [Ruminococcaceae bacterium]|nr:DNA-protecting protein DprA [Oscillospiraceae bacterium]
MNEMKKQLWVWLTTCSMMTTEKITALLEVFGSVEAIYKADAKALRERIRLTHAEATALGIKSLETAERIIAQTEKLGGTVLHIEDPRYPEMLRRMPDPPYVLYLRGKLPPWERIFGIAVVGTRECTDYGINATRKICYELAQRGVCVVSGMARGIDSAASEAALDAGGYSIAVLGCGVDVIYPPEKKNLFYQLLEHGTILSEYPLGSPPSGWHFPLRNRIMSGLSRGVLAVEAPQKSGTLITVQYALESGKDVFSVPGPIHSKTSAGTNLLIQQGAKLVTCGQDILDEYPVALSQLTPITRETKQQIPVRKLSMEDARYQDLSEQEKKIIALLMECDMHIEQLQAKSGMDIASINATLPLLEMYDLICKLPGDYYQLVLA